ERGVLALGPLEVDQVVVEVPAVVGRDEPRELAARRVQEAGAETVALGGEEELAGRRLGAAGLWGRCGLPTRHRAPARATRRSRARAGGPRSPPRRRRGVAARRAPRGPSREPSAPRA